MIELTFEQPPLPDSLISININYANSNSPASLPAMSEKRTVRGGRGARVEHV